MVELWRPMADLPLGELKHDEDGQEYYLLTGDSVGPFRFLDSEGCEYVVFPADDSTTHEWDIWIGDDFVPLALEADRSIVGWLPLEAYEERIAELEARIAYLTELARG